MKAPDLPTATVTKIFTDNLTFGMKFEADEVDPDQLAYYGGWYADFELTVNKDVTFDANGTGDGWLSGRYEAWNNGNWVNVPISPVSLEADKPLKIMEFAANLLGQSGLKMTYEEILENVQNFDCGVFFDEEFLNANPDLKVTLELRMYNPADENETYTVGETYIFTLDDMRPALPTATVTEILTEDLTFARNFVADEVEPEQLAYYDKWYADFELTVNKDVTFYTGEDADTDGYLSGQYDEWSTNWVNVPFKAPVTLKANETLKIMATAAEQMGEPGLKYTYGEVYEVVKDFDCGAFFTADFLAANPDLEVKLELRMYNPADETESYVIGDTYVFTLDKVKPNLPTATVKEIENEDLTFAMNFVADEVEPEQLAYYDKWYADFELTVNKDVTFYTGEGSDGWLSGQYDEWSENWVNVPFNPYLEASRTFGCLRVASFAHLLRMLGRISGLSLTMPSISAARILRVLSFSYQQTPILLSQARPLPPMLR